MAAHHGGLEDENEFFVCVYYIYIHTCVFLLKLLHMGKLTMPPRKAIPWCSFEVTVAFEPIDDQHFVCKACL